MRELALARKLAESPVIKNWARKEEDPSLRTAALNELEAFRQIFSDHSYFFAIKKSGHYYYNDHYNSYAGKELRYTLNPELPDDFWFYRTMESGQPYLLNVDYDEKIRVTKVWINVVVRDADKPIGVIGTGIDLSDFISSVVTSGQPGVSNIFIEGSGAIQASSQQSSIDFRTISKKEGERKTIFQLIDSEKDGARLRQAIAHLNADKQRVEILTASLGGKNFLLGIGAIGDIGWYSITLLDTAAIIGKNYLVPFALLLFVALLILSASLGMLLNRFVLDRIDRLDNLMQAFAKGEEIIFEKTLPDDEMGRLENSFNRMGTVIREHEKILEKTVSERTQELAERNIELNHALAEIKTLQGILPICVSCKQIRDDAGTWNKIEHYIETRTDVKFSHGLCSDCESKLYGAEDWYRKKKTDS